MSTYSPAFRFALIAPYPQLATIARRQAESLNCQLTIIDGAFDTVAHQVSELNDDIDVVISRGGTAEKIRPLTTRPVVSIGTSVLDLLHLLLPYRDDISTVALFNYHHEIVGIDAIEQALDIRITQLVFNEKSDIPRLLKSALKTPFDYVIGGVLLSQPAQAMGIPCLLLEASNDAINRALLEALAIAKANLESQRKASQLNTILSTIAEGIIVTDAEDNISAINPPAAKIINQDIAHALGKKIRKFIPRSMTRDVLESKTSQMGELLDIGDTTFVTNRVPILSSNRCVGVVCSLSESGSIKNAEKRLRQKEANSRGFISRYRLSDIKSKDETVIRAKKMAEVYAKTESNVLIYGESGIGKEIFAHSIHHASSRKNSAFVAINCAAIPENLLESELFGYVDGAFSGASRKGKVGLFELAHGGTLFLDEIGEITLGMQTRLLRVLQEKEIMRVGGNELIPVDIRIIAATNQNLKEMVNANAFRRDLYYRLNTLPLNIAPLRERGNDIAYLTRYFLNQLGAELSDTELRDVDQRLQNYPFPGNIRELKSILERFVILNSAFTDMSCGEIIDRYCLSDNGFEITSSISDDKNGLAIKVPLLNNFKQMTRYCQRQIIT